jgi:hypothetical protein
MVVISKKISGQTEAGNQEQHWDNPGNPEKAADARDVEQLKRQKKEAERRKENLTESNQPSTNLKN